MKPKILLGFALVLSGGWFGCSSDIPHKEKSNGDESVLSKTDPASGSRTPAPYETVTNAINREDWKFLLGLTSEGMGANHYIEYWKKNPVRVGKLISVEKDFSFSDKRCTRYSFALSFKDGRPHPHWLQVIVGPEGGQSAIMDFWEFGW
jgi:hypothetical protein